MLPQAQTAWDAKGESGELAFTKYGVQPIFIKRLVEHLAGKHNINTNVGG